jgi:hypothetical protein
MKKFYFSIFASALLMVGISSQAQTYNSIFANPSNFTFDDPRFWIGGAPPNPCGGCFININSSTTMPPNAAQSTALPATTNVLNGVNDPGSSHNDGQPLTVGMKFQSTVAGQVLGASFFKTGLMTGAHIGALYDINGTLLASAPFTAETASDWQTQAFGAPVTIQPGVTYIIAVFMADGWYTFTDNTVNPGPNFTTAIQNGNMIGVADATGNPNATFAYGTALTFPSSFFTPGVNYWVDVNFAATPYNFADVVFNGSSIHAIGTVNLNVSTVTHLNGTSLTMGNEPTFTQNLFVNDQMFLDPGSSIRLANTVTTANANNDIGHTPLVGTFNLGVGIFPGIYTVRSSGPGPLNATDITLSSLLNSNWDGSYTTPVSPYTLNCTITCAPGLVFGPAITQYDAINNFYGFAASTVLPVVLVQLIATRNDDGSIKISWATSQEENAGYYDVERSSDQSGWTKIGTVKAKGYSSTTTNYSFTDRLPLDGTGYYRLKMTDLDGKFTYSKTVSVADSKTKVPLVVYSNPFSDQIRLKVNVSRSQNLVMSVSDMMGKTYLSQSYHAQSGDNFVNLLPPISASGMYILRIHGDSYDQTVKLEKQ